MSTTRNAITPAFLRTPRGTLVPRHAATMPDDDAACFCAYYAQLNGADALDKPCWALNFHLIEAEGE